MKSRRAWRKAMLKAIDRARTGILFKSTTRTNGLRAIREFERVNGRSFDPFDDYHCTLVAGMGPHAGLFRHLRLKGLLPPAPPTA